MMMHLKWNSQLVDAEVGRESIKTLYLESKYLETMFLMTGLKQSFQPPNFATMFAIYRWDYASEKHQILEQWL